MILLTGGAGFIGSAFLRKLNDLGYNDIIVVDHLAESPKWKNLVSKKFIKYIPKEDLFELLDKKNELHHLDSIIHLGACSRTTERNVDYVIRNNYEFSIKLAEFAHEHDIRFIYASSAATYGRGEEGYTDTTFYNLKPLNPYGFSKYLFDLWVINKNYDKKFVGLKFFNVFGPNEYHKDDMSSMVYKAYYQIKNTKKVQLFRSNSSDFTDGGQMRDFVYVKDVCDIMARMLENKHIYGIFNIGTGVARSWNDLINSVFKALNMEPNIEYIDMPENIRDQYQNFTQADLTKLKNKIKDFHFASLEDSIQDYVCNYLEKDWQYL
jgi:ADP-L-glycero-D-manno-heptose 6-epimerase